MKAEKSPLFGLLQGCVRLYPPEFRARFADEILLTCHDHFQEWSAGKADFWLGTFSDLFASILNEWIDEVRSDMRLSNVFKGVGLLLIVLWFVNFLAITGIGLLGWTFSGPMHLALDHVFDSTGVMSLSTGLMTAGPLIAFLAFLMPQLRVHADGEERSLEIKVRPMARYSAQMLLLSGILSLVILGFFIATRL